MMQAACGSADLDVHADGQTVNNLRFADDIDLIAESEVDLQTVTDTSE